MTDNAGTHRATAVESDAAPAGHVFRQVVGHAPPGHPTTSLPRQIAMGMLTVLAITAIAFGWRWALVVATTEDRPPEYTTPPMPPVPTRSVPSIDLEVTRLGVRAAAAPAPADQVVPASVLPARPASRVTRTATPTKRSTRPVSRAGRRPAELRPGG